MRDVMQLVPSLGPGGTERLVIEIVRQLQAISIRSLVCCLDHEGAWAHELTSIGVSVIALNRPPGFRPGISLQIARLADRFSTDVIHCHHYSPFVYGQLAALLRPGLRVVFTEHGRLSDAPPSWKRRCVNPVLGRLPAAIYSVSHDLRRHMIAEGFSPSRVGVVHNGIEVGPLASAVSRCSARASLGVPGDALVVGTVARLDPVKDLTTAIKAFAAVTRQVPNAVLVVIGDGSERADLCRCAASLAVADRVIFTGHRDDARALLPAFDVYVNSSSHEGISLTILEAMAASVPVVATCVGGNPEVVSPDTGILVPPKTPDALAAALAALARDQGRRAQLGGAARRRVERSFSVDDMVARYVADYLATSAEARTASVV
jgi:glycosyltransferase involved in cell wall biosynthesis